MPPKPEKYRREPIDKRRTWGESKVCIQNSYLGNRVKLLIGKYAGEEGKVVDVDFAQLYDDVWTLRFTVELRNSKIITGVIWEDFLPVQVTSTS